MIKKHDITPKDIKDLSKKQKKGLLGLYEKINRDIRGSILELSVTLEQMTTICISSFFVKNTPDQWLFTQTIFNESEISFSNKIRILEKIVHLRFQKFEKKHSNLFKKLNRIRKLRNRLAHTMPDLTAERRIEDVQRFKIRLEYYEDGKIMHHVLSIDDVSKAKKEATDAFHELYELFYLIAPIKK